ncbi:Proton-dependent oligopeptide transporter family protein [Dioscorea alata]|uniref:Proton-dependent oligopeptide transporter family protein n=1 Tax=Dioscorea alata TaxID=55571 RepID=A0ACB7W8R6_DIOAL|nr:Proton-dependent oligopeptide transporter family protein [Dioscorea alata]
MGSEEGLEQSLLSEDQHTQNEICRPCSGDGSVDINGNPSLRHHTGNWKSCLFILGTECCERLAYYGIVKNLVTYLITKFHEGNAIAARNVTTWQGTCYLTTLIGASIADSYLGRFKTIAVFSTIYLIGMLILTLSASVPALKPPSCVGIACLDGSTAQYAIFFVGLYLIALGTGGIKPCVSSFGADQFDDTDPLERVSKGSYFNWFYFSINIGSLISGTLLVWIQDNYGWGLGFGIPTVFMALAILSFFSGTTVYRFQKPGGSPFTRNFQVIVASIRKWHIAIPHDSSLLFELPNATVGLNGIRKLEHSSTYKFLDKAATISNLDVKFESSPDPWRLCTVTQVEELKILLRMFPILATGIMYSAIYAQNSSMFLEQGMALDKRFDSFTIPPATLSSFDVISVIIWVPIYDKLLIPIARRLTGNERGISQLQRIGIGLFISILTVTAAALVETKRLQIAKAEGIVHEKVTVPMSILWQIPQFSLAGLSEVFTCIGQLEFFYDQAPDNLRSLCTALTLVLVALGSYLSSLILSIVMLITTQRGNPGWIPDNLNEGHLDRFFWLLAGLSFLNLMVYVHYAMKYKHKM